VIVPSEATRADVARLYGIPSDRISIVPEGADDSFAPIEDANVLRATRVRFFGEDVPYVLFVGKFSQRRNIPALIEAFGAVKRSNGLPHKLLLYGANVHDLPLDRIARDAGVERDVVQTNEKLEDHREIIPVYSAADLYVFPSLYEGATLTTVEAMACGLPVVTVDRGAVSEIVGDDALKVDEPTPDKLANAIGEVLRNDALRRDLGRRALERSRSFRLSATAQGTLDVLREVAAS
jgi:glycosyltransferase involved in cell wall biosynthesis